MKKAFCLIFIFSFLSKGISWSQDTNKPLSVSGYASWLYSAIFDTLSGPWINSNMLHNRINLKAYAGKSFVFDAEIRNRIVTGNMVSANPYYGSMLADDQGWADFSWNLIDEREIVFNTTVDRVWVEFNKGSLQVMVGRQRINWSQTLVWNPNDIFNTYSFFDFDYVERHGSDAARIIYSPTASSAAEVAVKAEHDGSITSAALYRFNLLGFDIQFLGGEMTENTIVAGTGWSGAIGSWSLRGEATWFQPYNDVVETRGTGVFTLGTDKSFSDKLTAVAQVMYCNKPVALYSFTDLYYGGLNAAQLAFSKITSMGQMTWIPMPLINITGSAIWYPDLKGVFAGPSIDISIAENVDFTLIWQYFHSTINNTETRVNLAFLRFRYSF